MLKQKINKRQPNLIRLAFFFFFLLFLFSSPVLADKVVVETQNGYGILTPKQETIQEGKNYTMHIDVYDLSDGTYVSNESATCYLNLFNGDGTSFFLSEFEYSGNLTTELAGQWYVEIPGDTFEEIGTYTYFVECDENAGNLGGSRSEALEVTPTGKKDYYIVNMIIFSLAALLIVGGIIKSDPSITAFGNLGLYYIGIFIIQYGIAGQKNWMINALSAIILALAFYITYRVFEGYWPDNY